MNSVLIVCAIVVTLAIVVAIVFVIRTLLQVQRTAREAEMLIKNLNEEISTVLRITGNISAFVDRLSSPWVRVGSWFTGIASMFFRNRRKEGSEGTEKSC